VPTRARIRANLLFSPYALVYRSPATLTIAIIGSRLGVWGLVYDHMLGSISIGRADATQSHGKKHNAAPPPPSPLRSIVIRKLISAKM
jgi:hypothetical protein